jgi:hypothetical protein
MDPGAQIELVELLSGVRRLPVKEAMILSEEHKPLLLVVIGYRRKGDVSKTRVGEILGREAFSILDDLLSQGLIYCAVGLAGPTEASRADFISSGKKRDFRRTPQQKSECFPQPHIRAPRFLVALHAELLAKSLLRNRRPSRPEMWSIKVARLRRASKEIIRASTLDVFWAKYIMRSI